VTALVGNIYFLLSSGWLAFLAATLRSLKPPLRLPLKFTFLKELANQASRLHAVCRKRTAMLTLYLNATGNMPQLHTGRSFVDLLPAWPRTANKALHQVTLKHMQALHAQAEIFWKRGLGSHA
jgi:hypothetical protein